MRGNIIQLLDLRPLLFVLAFFAIGPLCAAETLAGRTLGPGWSSWQVKAPANARSWCCFDNFGKSPQQCNLDARQQNYGSRDHSTTDHMRLYAKIESGELTQLRVFAARCPVIANSAIEDLGNLDAKPSLLWLDQAVTQAKLNSEQLLAAMAMHEQADSYLRTYALGHKSARVRGQSWFWRTQMPVAGVENEALSQLPREPSNSVQDQIVFAISQLPSERAIAALIRAIENRKLSWEQRKKALFWLAQSKEQKALDYLDAALAVRP